MDAAASSDLRAGLRDSVPIAVGYLTVALAFGLFCAQAGIPTLAATVVSLTNLSSSGQFAGATVWAAGGTLLELALAVALVNLRYVLMAVSLGQRLAPGTPTWQRLVMAFGVTDEIYALAMRTPRVTFAAYAGSMLLPIAGWTLGTLAGALVGSVLPPLLVSAFGVLLFGMFVAIVVPVARADRAVLAVVLVAVVLSCLLAWLPWTAGIDVGWRIIIVTLLAAAGGAFAFPREAA